MFSDLNGRRQQGALIQRPPAVGDPLPSASRLRGGDGYFRHRCMGTLPWRGGRHSVRRITLRFIQPVWFRWKAAAPDKIEAGGRAPAAQRSHRRAGELGRSSHPATARHKREFCGNPGRERLVHNRSSDTRGCADGNAGTRIEPGAGDSPPDSCTLGQWPRPAMGELSAKTRVHEWGPNSGSHRPGALASANTGLRDAA